MNKGIRRDKRANRDRLCSFDQFSISGRIGAWILSIDTNQPLAFLHLWYSPSLVESQEYYTLLNDLSGLK